MNSGMLGKKEAGKFHDIQYAVKQLLKYIETDGKVNVKASISGGMNLNP